MKAKYLVSIVFFYLCLCSATQAQGFSKLVVFGDSLSDTGNLAGATIDLPFPFFQNRISNGPVLADYLATQIGSNADASLHLTGQSAGFNYAVAGGNIIGTDPEDLAAQVSAYLARTQNAADSQALYFIFMGGNDLRDIRSLALSADASVQIDAVLDQLEAQLRRLAAAGATTFLIPNMPNIGRLPETIERQAADPMIIARAQTYSLTYNQRLTARLESLKSELKIGITGFDLYNELESLLANAEQSGFTQTEIGCFELNGLEVNFQADCVFGTRFDRFVFFDNIHPSAKTNQLISELLAEIAPTDVFSPRKPFTVAPILQLLLER